MLSAKSRKGLLCGSVMMVKCFLMFLTPAFFSAASADSTCDRVSAVPPDLRNADEMGLGDVQPLVHPLEHAAPAQRIGIVVEFDKGALGGFLAQHRQRLAAQAGAADAQHRHGLHALADGRWPGPRLSSDRRCARGSAAAPAPWICAARAASPAPRRPWPARRHRPPWAGRPCRSAQDRGKCSAGILNLASGLTLSEGFADTAPSLPNHQQALGLFVGSWGAVTGPGQRLVSGF